MACEFDSRFKTKNEHVDARRGPSLTHTYDRAYVLPAKASTFATSTQAGVSTQEEILFWMALIVLVLENVRGTRPRNDL